ncbi:pimeloyl-ACP methyl ester carboxylesterase [Pseudonocardia eucalypti]|uniref:alpha/beta fold hydrolase n=1 Tax=Pseudonocardia eucalypti TaxID=648755 RepID=UPI00160D2CAE|nr:pimeloyl-ACP methyl ester carboxylesterase [Pseudonocardia eucalypti]
MLREHQVKLGPVRTCYFEGGNRLGHTVVLVHEGGYGGDAPNTFGRLAERLADEYYLVLPEMLGFGGTDKAVFFGENPYEPRLRHLAAFLDALDLGEAHFVGNSFGGGMVLRLSIREETSWRMKSATSISGTGGPFRTPEALKEMAEYLPSIEAAWRLDSWILHPGARDEAHARARFESSMRPGQWEVMTAPTLRNPAQPEQARPWDFPEALSASAVPTLLVAGTLDRMLEAGWEDMVAKHLKHVRVERLEAGHSPNISHPDDTAILLRDFFDHVDGR